MKGITEYQNEKNGFYVIQLHYSCDPERDPDTPEGKAWIAREKQKYDTEADWRKEQEIDWGALSGELVYPTFGEHNIIEPFEPPKHWTRYRCIDPGLRVPCAVLWCAVDPEGNHYYYLEHYVKEKTIDWHCKRIKEYELWDIPEQKENIHKKLIDPASFARSPIDKRTLAGEFASFGIICDPANNDKFKGIQRIRRLLKPDKKTGLPRIFICRHLVNLINEMKEYRYPELTAIVAERKDESEDPKKKNDHLLDCMRYIENANPQYIKIIKRKHKREDLHSWDGMSTGY